MLENDDFECDEASMHRLLNIDYYIDYIDIDDKIFFVKIFNKTMHKSLI